MICEKNGCRIMVLEFVSEGFICMFTPLLMWEALTLRANHMFTSFVMKLEPRGTHTTGLHWSSNSITPLINAQMLLADPVTHCFHSRHSLCCLPFFCTLVNGYCPTDAPVCLIMLICSGIIVKGTPSWIYNSKEFKIFKTFKRKATYKNKPAQIWNKIFLTEKPRLTYTRIMGRKKY